MSNLTPDQRQEAAMACLERARECHLANDAAGVRQAALDWLKTKHDAQLGDTVTLWGWKRPRTIVLRDIDIPLVNTDIGESYIEFIGPCISQKTIKGGFPESHLQPHYVLVVKKP